MKRDSLITTEEKLLFDILQEVKEINQKLTGITKPEPARPVRKATEGKVYKCKYCGKPHENRHKMASHVGKCPKKPKKEGA